MSTPFDRLLDSYRALSDSKRMQGNYLEALTKNFLLTDGVHSLQYKNVWLWNEWPERDGRGDNGIDLVAERYDGGIVAIQSKFYAENTHIAKSEIDSFISSSGKKPFTHRLWVDTTGRDWSTNAEEMLEGQHLPIQRVGLSDFRSSNIDWSTYEITEPEIAPGLHEKKQLRPHQHTAVTKTLEGFKDNERGKLIMACGTGKTFTSLKIAERLAEADGHARILFMVPSLALMSQSLKEWSDETELPLHAYAVCSDIKVGRVKNNDLTDVAIHDLQIPATTDGKSLVDAMSLRSLDEGITVVFSTYQSIDAVSQAQKAGLPDFDLVICDEAHRTTGATLAGTDESNFVKIHSNQAISAAKRLYMTATPRVFNDSIKDKAKENDAVLCSMDDLELYGPVFHRIGFGEAVTNQLLTDYKVLVLGVDETQIVETFQKQLSDSNMELQIDDVAKLIGCWNGLAKRRAGLHEASFGTDLAPMRRAVAFNRDIKSSKLVKAEFPDLVRTHLADLENDDPTDDLQVQVQHVDGGFNAIKRAELLDWLKEDTAGDGQVCRILTNARCLTEGVDVPSLDAVLFLNPRNSMVDVIQAVGRVMRRAEGKQFGYIILPIAIPEGMSTSEALKDNERYKVVWQVLQALRAHDERMDTAINQIELNSKAPESIIVDKIDLKPKKKSKTNVGGNSGGVEGTNGSEESSDGEGGSHSPTGVQGTLDFPVDEWKDSVYAKIVDKCGNRMYWADWSKDIANIANKHIALIKHLLQDAETEHRAAFDEFLEGLQQNLNPEIDEEQGIEMLAQHLVTKPIFDAMFRDSNFTEHNPVSVAMQKILEQLDQNSAFENERTGLEKFYESVRARVKDIDNADAKQQIILELYDNFFRNAFPRVADRLGIVFTPVPVVDYILRSADAALRLEFGKSLSDEGVSILEPFVGTGTFVTRLLQSGLIKPEDLHRKYTQELFANEIVLLSYYIAAINIETVYAEHAKKLGIGPDEYVPFDGIALTDTFQLNEDDGKMESNGFFPENHARVTRQKNQGIRVIVMNPPYSSGQASANDNNQNQKYPLLDASIESTYAKQSTATLKNSLYDSYIRGIRWASNRITDDGVIAFVSNGSFIDGNAADGLRKTFANEFSRIFIYNLRGNARTSGEQRRKESGNVFKEGSRTQVAVAVLIKNSNHSGPAEIHYRDIGDYFTREQKLDILIDEISLEGTPWEIIAPNVHGDWINHRDEKYDAYQVIGDKATKGKPNTTGVFENYSNGVKTNRDAWCYNFSSEEVEANMLRSINFYNDHVERFLSAQKGLESSDPANFIEYDSTQFTWDRVNKSDLAKGRKGIFDPKKTRSSMYRPFCKQALYFDSTNQFNNCVYQLPKIFPTSEHKNIAFGTTGRGATKEFSVQMVNETPDLELVSKAQWFSLYTYEKYESDSDDLLSMLEDSGTDNGYRRRENITDATLETYLAIYRDTTITKEDIFFYIYGLLHSAEYRKQYAADLTKMMPRIPKVKDFWGFSLAGRSLSELHLNYESVDPYPLEEVVKTTVTDAYEMYRVQKLTFLGRKDKSGIIYNQNITLRGIPEESLEYMVNGKSALEWIIERYQVTVHKASQIRNDPNEYSREIGNPRYIIDLIKRIVTVSMETNRIVALLPALDIIE